MTTAIFRAVHPTLPVADIERTVRFYAEKLGFRLAFRAPSNVPATQLV